MRVWLLPAFVLVGCAGEPSQAAPQPEPAHPAVEGCAVRDDAVWGSLGGPGSTPSHLVVGEHLALAVVDTRLFASHDDGLSWVPAPSPRADAQVTAAAAWGTRLYLGLPEGVVGTEDGLRWTSIGGTARPTFLAADADGLFAGNGFGLVRYEAGAWNPVAGPKGVVFDKAVRVDDTLVANAPASGLYRRADDWSRPSGTDTWGYEDLVARGRRVLVASSFGVLHSSDGGASFAPVLGPLGGRIDSVVGLAHLGEKVVVATRRGLLAGPAGGPVTLLDARPITALGSRAGLVLTSGAAGLRRSLDGITWTDAGPVVATRPSFVLAVDGALLSEDGDRALRSEDGRVWVPSTLGGSPLRLAHAAVQGSRVVAVAGLPGAGATGLVRSEDGGRTFERLPVPRLPWTSAAVSALAIDGDRILLATRSADDGGQGVRFSQDGGLSFAADNRGLPASSRLDAPWLPARVVYLRGDVALLGIPGQGLYRRTTDGWRWASAIVPEAIFDPPAGVPALAVVVAEDGGVHRLDTGGRLVRTGAAPRAARAAALVGGLLIVAGEDGAAWASADLGASFRTLGGALPAPILALTGYAGRLVAATDGAGLAAVDLRCVAP